MNNMNTNRSENLEPKVSIVVPVFKVEKYLSQCVDSLLAQTLKEIEIILVDDGSPDNSPKICDDYAQKDNRVRVIHKENQGVGRARRSGYQEVRGKYVAFFDSDDYVSKDLYKTLYDRAEEANLDACFCDILNFSDGREPYPYTRESTELSFKDKQSIMTFSLNMLCPLLSQEETILYPHTQWNYIVRRDKLVESNVEFVSEREYVSEDLIFNLLWIPYANRIEWIEKPLIYHRVDNASSLTNNLKFQKVEASIRMVSKVKEILDGQYSNVPNCEEYYYSYAFKLIRDIRWSIIRFVPSWGNKYSYMSFFLHEVVKLVPEKLTYYNKMHPNKRMSGLELFSMGRIRISIIAYMSTTILKALQNRARRIVHC